MNFILLIFFLQSYSSSIEDSFLARQRLSDNLKYVVPIHKHRPIHKLKISIRTGLNKTETEKIAAKFGDEYELEDILEEIDYSNLFKFSVRSRYRFKNGCKVYIQDQIKGRSHILSVGVILN